MLLKTNTLAFLGSSINDEEKKVLNMDTKCQC